MDERLRFVAKLLDGESMTEVCREFGISRKTGYKIRSSRSYYMSGRKTRTSTRPLTLRELEEFFKGAWSIFDVLEMNFGDDGYDLERMQGFLVGVESQFYPQLGELYERRISAWAAGRQAELGLHRAEEDLEQR